MACWIVDWPRQNLGIIHLPSMTKCPPDFYYIHENLIQLYCKVEPDNIELKDLFDSVKLFGGGLAFCNPIIRRYSSHRRQNIKRRRHSPSKIFVATDFYPFFEPNKIINTLLASQSLSRTQTTMTRNTRSRGGTARDDGSVVVDDDDFTEADEILAASLRNLNVGRT